MAFNEAHGITPQSVSKAVRELLEIGHAPGEKKKGRLREQPLTDEEQRRMEEHIEEQMLQAAANLDFELAAKLRDRLFDLRGEAVPVQKEQTKSRQRARRRGR